MWQKRIPAVGSTNAKALWQRVPGMPKGGKEASVPEVEGKRREEWETWK